MKKYNFLANVNKHIEKAQEQEKKEQIGNIISSLQRPFTELTTSVYVEQVNQVQELINNLGWKK